MWKLGSCARAALSLVAAGTFWGVVAVGSAQANTITIDLNTLSGTQMGSVTSSASFLGYTNVPDGIVGPGTTSSTDAVGTFLGNGCSPACEATALNDVAGTSFTTGTQIL